MAKPTSRGEFEQYCLRALGAPVININVAVEQIDDRIDEALELFVDKHMDATIQEWVTYPVTQTDIDNGYIQLPSDILEVVDILPTATIFAHSGMFSYQYQVMIQQLSPWQSFSNLDYYMKMTSFQETLDMTSVSPTFVWQRHGDKLRVNYDFPTDYPLAIKVHRIIDPELETQIWNDRWLKDYCVALIKKQWGENTSKFQNIQLLGGVTIDGNRLVEEANADIERLKEELETSLSYPTDFFIG
jgi:hypothetical protein